MAVAGSLALLVLLSGFLEIYSIKDGSVVSQCDYPGVVTLIASTNNLIICNGVRVYGALYIPELCGAGLEEALTKVPVLMVYGDGTTNATIPADSKGTVTDGVYKLEVPESNRIDCNSEVVVYQSGMKIATSSCEVVGYGGTDKTAKIYDGSLQMAKLTKSTSDSCCRVIFDSLTDAEKGPVVDENVSLNCVVSSGAPCGTGDLGGPVYCRENTGVRVVVGLVATAPCESGGMFLMHDMTGDSSLKFGVAH